MHPEHKPLFLVTSRSRMDKSLNSLIGLIEGITIDGQVNEAEINLLQRWLLEHIELRNIHPFNELIPVLEQALSDGFLDDEEREAIHWLCNKLLSTEYYNEVTAGLQVLHGILGGIAADGKITSEELSGLSDWLSENDHLRTCYPYEEVDGLITSVLSKKSLGGEEHKVLQDFFSEFISVLDDKTITKPLMKKEGTVEGVCAICPEIVFQGSVFCFTGASSRYSRTEFERLVINLGGKAVSSVSNKLNYLVIGSEGNQCWSYACYGRKVESAVMLRKSGARLLIVHENDFHDAVADYRK